MGFDLWWSSYSLVGAFVGLLAGLLGVGGGLTTVPLFTMLFVAQGFSREHVLHIALGTSMANIMFTSLSSMRTHHQHGAVDWKIVRTITPGVLIGGWIGGGLAAKIPTMPLTLIFCGFVFYTAYNMFAAKKPAPARQMPGAWGTSVVGGVVGVLSALISAGGGFITIPFMVWCNVNIKRAVGTSAAIGFPIAVAGTISYIAAGWNTPGLPPHHFGFVYLPAFVFFVITSVFTAPLGAKLAHRLPGDVVKKIFAIMLIIIGLKMAWTLI